jgi:hypothetical protein
MLLSKLSSFIRNHLHLKVRTEVGVSDITRCINDVPKYLALKSLNDVSVALFRASPQLYAVGLHRLQYLFYSISLWCIDRADLLTMSLYIFFHFSPGSWFFFPPMCLPAQLSIQDLIKWRYICMQ